MKNGINSPRMAEAFLPLIGNNPGNFSENRAP